MVSELSPLQNGMVTGRAEVKRGEAPPGKMPMNVALRRGWTVAEFLRWEEGQELRWEFDGFRPVAMTGGTSAHSVIQANLVTELTTRLRGKPCRCYGNSLKIEAMGSIRYPDAFVSCTPINRTSTLATEPVVIFEILSPSTASTDRFVKNREYAGTASVRRYVMLEQAVVGGTMFARTAAGEWLGRLLGADDVIDMPEIGIDLPMAALYAELDLPAEADGED